MKNKKISAVLLALASTGAFAGTMGDVATPSHLLLLEAGGSYGHSFYDTDVVFPESRTALNPAGVAINLKNFYPNDFFGGYIGASIYSPNNWLLNVRYDMYGEKSKTNVPAETRLELAPSRLAFTVDKVMGDFQAFSFGVGGGAIIENLNDGNFEVAVGGTNPLSESIQGRTRIDPLAEVFAMYRCSNDLGVKLNVGYQIPVNNKFGNGDVLVNLGVNKSFPF